jgi:hypothetical protein
MSNFIFTTDYNYQKVANEGSYTVSCPNASGPTDVTTHTVAHDLGEITSVRAWYDPASGRRFPISLSQYLDDSTFISEVSLVTVYAYLTTSSLVFNVRNTSGSTKAVTLYWKVYYDD